MPKLNTNKNNLTIEKIKNQLKLKGLNCSGNKDVLWKRLRKSMTQKQGDTITDDSSRNCSSNTIINHTKLNKLHPKFTKPAPDFKGIAVINGTCKEISLSNYSGKYVVLFFFPLNFTFVCSTEIIGFSDRILEFRHINTEVIGCSVDSQFSHLVWQNLSRTEGGIGKINIPVISDLSHRISKSYGVYLKEYGHAMRGLFIIDGRGILRHITINDLSVGRSIDETIRLLKAFQFTDGNSKLCPLDWKPNT